MPAPIDIAPQYSRPPHNPPFGSSFPKQEANLDFYEFQPVIASSENESVEQDYSQKLESSFCRDFSCCGLLLEDLHDLLQHYEECHVRFEGEDLHCNFYDEDWSDGSPPNSPAAPAKHMNGGNVAGGTNTLLKRKAVSLSDIYAEEMAFCPDGSSAFDTSVLRSSQNTSNLKKRSLSQFAATSASLDMTSTIKRLAINTHNLGTFSGLPTPTEDELLSHGGALFIPANNSAATTGNFMITAEELMVRKQEALSTMEQHISRPSSTLIVDKPYKCPVSGCDKAYKNPNGLKYHNQHGHCNTLSANEGDRPSLKPYQCTVDNCGKRYKNLNGLKYHIEHHHLPSLVIGQITPDSTPSASSMPTPMTTPMTTPMSTPMSTPLSSPIMTSLVPNHE